MIDWVTLTFNMGFPAGLATYMIVRLEKTLLSLTLAINTLKIIMDNRK